MKNHHNDDTTNELALEQLEAISGGGDLATNARIAQNVCGEGKVASVSESGFTCKAN